MNWWQDPSDHQQLEIYVCFWELYLKMSRSPSIEHDLKINSVHIYKPIWFFDI